MHKVLWLLLFCWACLVAQPKEDVPSITERATAAVSEMSKLQFMTGNWKGKGLAFVQNKQFPTTVDTSVQSKLYGKVLIIEANDHLPFLPEKAQGGLLAVSFDGAAKKYQAKFCLGDGRWIDAWGAVDGQSFTWGYGFLRTTFKLNGAVMSVVSEVSVDNTWRKVQEATLRRGK